MIRSQPFPIRIDDLTPAFLGAVLGTRVESIDATRVGADRGMLGALFQVEISYAVPEHGPDRMIAKFAALREGALASARRGRTHERELRCYTELLPETPVAAPKVYGAWYDPDTAHFLLLQAVAPVDPTVEQVQGLTVDQARAVLVEAARLHAYWWREPRLDQLSWLPRTDAAARIENLTVLAEQGWPLLADLVADELTPADHALGSGLAERLPTALQSLAVLPSTLLHCDLRADNLLFSPEDGAVTLVDWQGAGIGPPSFDLAYFLVQSLTVEDRRRHERMLLEFYRSELARCGVELTMTEVLAGWSDALNYGLTIGCALPVISDPTEPRVRELAATVARRSLAAMHDHNEENEEKLP